jgi:hypothetical protein
METLRYLNKQYNQNERQNFSNWWKEQIQIYGQEIVYYSNQTTLSGSNVLYGEQPDAGFGDGHPMIVLGNLNNDSVLLSKFGLVADGEWSGVLHKDLYTQVYGLSSEPKRGDLMALVEYGADRINYPKRGTTIYELTDVVDEFKGNALMGHYVWFFTGKRYDYSLEPESPGPGTGNVPLEDNDLVEQIADQNFNYIEDNPDSNTSVYGEY